MKKLVNVLDYLAMAILGLTVAGVVILVGVAIYNSTYPEITCGAFALFMAITWALFRVSFWE